MPHTKHILPKGVYGTFYGARKEKLKNNGDML